VTKSASSMTGKVAPDFKLLDKDEKAVTLKSIGKKKKVIYFYPKDDTPGCTIEAKEFSDALKTFNSKDIVVIGISGGNSKTKAKFCEKYKLAHILVSDTDFAVAKKWQSFGTKKFMGREYQGIFRNTFLLDENNKVLNVFESVTPKGHAKEVLNFFAAPNKEKVVTKQKDTSKNLKAASKKVATAKKIPTKTKKATSK
jgi:peroxiredoxin Q/BCP